MSNIKDLAVNTGRIKALYEQNETARHILDHLASRERNWRKTTVDRIQSNIRSNGCDVSRASVVSFFRELEECGCGRFKTGRKGHPSRFECTAQMTSVGRAATGEAIDVQAVTDDDSCEEETHEELIRHNFRLRPEFWMTLELPTDLTEKEAIRIAEFVRSLPFE